MDLHSNIQTYDYIPHKFKHDKYKITRIIFVHDERNIVSHTNDNADTLQ